MDSLTLDRPLRVAVVGSGPAAFYTVQHLFGARDREYTIDMFERLPTPFGLVRHGVAPDHPKIKSVTAVYHRLAQKPGFRFFGNVDYGRHIGLADLRAHYDQIVFCTGAQTDRRMNIPGEDLRGSYPATEFVAWYNGHPDYCDHQFDLDQERAVVVGVGNVAVDVARILARDPEELAATDIAAHALDALRKSRIREVYLLGRRGPTQAAFTNPEARELGDLEGCETSALAEEVELDELSRQSLEASGDKGLRQKVEILNGLVGRSQPDRKRRLILRFLVSPVELLDDGSGAVGAVKLVKNRLYASDDGALRPRATGSYETIDAGLVFRSVGYQGIPVPELPFDDLRGVVPNDDGRVLDDDGRPLSGHYVSGWIKRGPSGVIGTNKPDAKETVDAMIEDLSGPLRCPANPATEAIPALLEERGVRFVSYDDWCRLDELEIERGRKHGRPRDKLTRREEFSAALADISR